MNNPIVSIIVPCYNQAQYLPETLQSVLDQEIQNWECIIVNDGSPDNTEEVALKWVEKDSRFKYFKKDNGGLPDTRNYGIKHSQGKYILPLDSDDKISKEYASEAIKVLEKNPKVKIVHCRIMFLGKMKGECILLPYTFYNQFFVRNCIHHCAVYRRADYDKTAGYNSNMKKGWEDYDFWLSLLSEEDEVVKLDGFHFFYRTKDVSMRTAITTNIESELRLQIFRNHLDVYLKYMNPLEMNKELKRLESLESSAQYKIGGLVLSPFRYLRKVFNNKNK